MVKVGESVPDLKLRNGLPLFSPTSLTLLTLVSLLLNETKRPLNFLHFPIGKLLSWPTYSVTNGSLSCFIFLVPNFSFMPPVRREISALLQNHEKSIEEHLSFFQILLNFFILSLRSGIHFLTCSSLENPIADKNCTDVKTMYVNLYVWCWVYSTICSVSCWHEDY